MPVEEKHVCRFELLMDAGSGAQKVGDILIRAFARTGRYVYIEPMIPAEISPPARTRPALSGTIIRVADFPLTNIGNNTDIIIASHEIVLDRRLDDDEHNPKCRIFLDAADRKLNEDSYEQVCNRAAQLGLTTHLFEIDDHAKGIIKSLAGKGRNMYYLGMLSCLYSAPDDVMVNEIKLTFGGKLKEDILNKNIEIFHCGYHYAKTNINFSYDVDATDKTDAEKILIDGNSALSMGVIDAGIKLVSGYPITPASSILHELAKVFPSYGGMVHQAEDEISAIGTAIGAYYAGMPAMTCTSGPGLSLKQEFIGYATAAETPMIIVDVQRSGPSTGMPTKTEQSDLFAVLYGSHGDNAKVVISVGTIVDCFYAPQLARYLAEKLRLPVFIMSDFQTANSYKVMPKPELNMMEDSADIKDFVLECFGLSRLPDNIEMVRTEQANPGTPEKMRRITGLNTDQTGKVNYFSKTNHRSHMVRNEKVHHVSRALKEPEIFGKLDEGDVLVVGWGSTYGAIEEAILSCQRQGLAVGGTCFKIVYPLPLMLDKVFSRFKKIVTVELSYGDGYKYTPLATLLRSSTLVDVRMLISEATGRPISPIKIERKVKELLSV
jgi:2-oxoglutarate ferredoxin oxidoreductase subunit alpha